MNTIGDDKAYPTRVNENLDVDGLTKREYMATALLQSLITQMTQPGSEESMKLHAEYSVKCADMLIEALNR